MAGSADYILKVVSENTDNFSHVKGHFLTRLPAVALVLLSLALRTIFKTSALSMKRPHKICTLLPKFTVISLA